VIGGAVKALHAEIKKVFLYKIHPRNYALARIYSIDHIYTLTLFIQSDLNSLPATSANTKIAFMFLVIDLMEMYQCSAVETNDYNVYSSPASSFYIHKCTANIWVLHNA